jgi:hypothetical protein
MLREGETLAKGVRMREWLAAHGLANLAVTIDGQDWSFEAPWVKARRAGDTRRLERLGRDYQAPWRRRLAQDGADPDVPGDPGSNLAASAVSGQTPPTGPQWVSGLAPLEPHALAYDKPLWTSSAVPPTRDA